MMTLREYRINLGWSVNKLAQEAGITRQAVANAEAGSPIRPETAKSIADAIGKAMVQDLKVMDIKGLNVL